METRRLTPPLFFLGFLLFLIGPGIYALQLHFKNLSMPWYVPVLAAAGLIPMWLSARQRLGVLRKIAAGCFGAVCLLEWLFFLSMVRSPAYSGPATPGSTIPSFSTKLSDGTLFTDQNLRDGTPSILVFYRGRW